MKNKKLNLREMDKLAEQVILSAKSKDLVDNYFETDDECHILVYINHENIYNDFSLKTVLTDELYEYIDSIMRICDAKKDLIIEINFTDGFSQEEKDNIVNLLKAHYAIEYSVHKKIRKRLSYVALGLLLFGALLLSLYIGFTVAKLNTLVSEIISIFSWVFIWESCDLFVFERHNQRLLCFKNMRLFNAEYIAH